MNPVFLESDRAIELHRLLIREFGGEDGLRDEGLLQSALAMPQSGFGGGYFHKDLFEMAAAYLFHIVQNHPFVDGNKRTGAATALLFLKLNGFPILAKEGALATLTLAVARGEAGKPTVTAFLRRHARKTASRKPSSHKPRA